MRQKRKLKKPFEVLWRRKDSYIHGQDVLAALGLGNDSYTAPLDLELVAELGVTAALALGMLQRNCQASSGPLIRDGLEQLAGMVHDLVPRLSQKAWHPKELTIFLDAASKTWPMYRLTTAADLMLVFTELGVKFNRVLKGDEDPDLLFALRRFSLNLSRYASIESMSAKELTTWIARANERKKKLMKEDSDAEEQRGSHGHLRSVAR